MLNEALAGLVAITASCAYVESWAAMVIGFASGIVVVLSIRLFEKLRIDDPIYALSSYGTAGIWGTLFNGLFATPELVGKVGIGKPGLLYGGGQGTASRTIARRRRVWSFAFIVSYAILYVMKKTMGLRVTEEEEVIGLDLSEHGEFGYPEQLKVNG